MSIIEQKVQIEGLNSAQEINPGKIPQYGKPDILFILFIYLMEVVNNNQKSAELGAKQLQCNALEQVAYNREDQRLNLQTVPEHFQHYTYKMHSHLEVGLGKKPGDIPVPLVPFLYLKITISKILLSSNNLQIQMAQSKNEANSDKRQGIASKLAVLGQIAQGEQVNMNTATNQASQSIDESSGLLTLLKAITQKIERNS